MLILCSPHNPVGRLWTRDELAETGRICVENGIIVVSDEIHSDLVLGGRRHVPFASISEELAARSVVCTAPSKTFNLAGLQTANLIIPDARLRRDYSVAQEECGFFSANVFGTVALEAAYTYGEPWLEALLHYIEANLRFLSEFITRKMPRITLIEPEATYLAWLDFRGLGMDSRALKDFLRHSAGVALGEGIFSAAGARVSRASTSRARGGSLKRARPPCERHRRALIRARCGRFSACREIGDEFDTDDTSTSPVAIAPAVMRVSMPSSSERAVLPWIDSNIV